MEVGHHMFFNIFKFICVVTAKSSASKRFGVPCLAIKRINVHHARWQLTNKVIGRKQRAVALKRYVFKEDQ
jgi:hypothetical protein